MSSLVHEQHFHVRAYEVGPDARASLPTLADYFQEIAGNHAEVLGFANDQLSQQELAWILVRLKLDVHRYPAWRETLRLVTWPSAVERLYAYRDVEVTDESGDPIALITSAWMMIDPMARRVARLPNELHEMNLPDRTRATTVDTFPIPELDHIDIERTFTVRREDIDMLRHVNNVRYAAWLLETVPDTVLETHEPASLDIAFRNEAVYGDQVQVQTSFDSETTALHRLINPKTDRLLAYARTLWRPLP